MRYTNLNISRERFISVLGPGTLLIRGEKTALNLAEHDSAYSSIFLVFLR